MLAGAAMPERRRGRVVWYVLKITLHSYGGFMVVPNKALEYLGFFLLLWLLVGIGVTLIIGLLIRLGREYNANG